MNIVILDKNTIGDDVNYDAFHELGHVIFYDYTKKEDVVNRSKDADVLVINKTKLSSEILTELKKLKGICITATGYDNVDLAYCKKHKIHVSNVRGYSTNNVAQHTFAMLLFLFENIGYYKDYVTSKKYINNQSFSHFEKTYHELKGKTIGIIGMGQIGQQVAKIAQAFLMNVIYYSTSGTNKSQPYKNVYFDDLLKDSDIISIHAPLNENTRFLINKSAFLKMKKGVFILNLGRGAIIDEIDLSFALDQDGLIGGVGLDVLSSEPMSATSPLIKHLKDPRLLITPHIAWASKEARQRLIDETVLNIKAIKNHELRNDVR
jgi:lactate dehydrogenase-like 2-hydroxyacid dehydrogenase